MSADAAAATPPGTFSLSRSLGGPRGLLESVLPYTVFSVVYGFGREVRPAIYAAVVPVVVLAVWRVVRRESLTQAVSGVVGVAIGAWAANHTGHAANFFLPSIVKNAGFGLAYAVSNLLRWPLLGLVVGSLVVAGETARRDDAGAKQDDAKQDDSSDEAADEAAGPSVREELRSMFGAMFAWRREPARLAAYQRATWIWVGMFAVRLAVQIPLYLTDRVTLLGLLNGLVLGVPLFALTLWLTWLVVRDVLGSAETP